MLQEENTNGVIIISFIFYSGCCIKYDVNVAVGTSIFESDVRIICIHTFLMLQELILMLQLLFINVATDRPMKKFRSDAHYRALLVYYIVFTFFFAYCSVTWAAGLSTLVSIRSRYDHIGDCYLKFSKRK